MSHKSLFSVYNDVEADLGRVELLQLNPAVVLADSGEKYAISAVCVGPPLTAKDERLSLSVRVGGEHVELASVDQRSEPANGARSCLTVALFETSRRLLQALASTADVEIRLGTDEYELRCTFGFENRRNVAAFLDQPEIGRPVSGAEGSTAESIAV